MIITPAKLMLVAIFSTALFAQEAADSIAPAPPAIDTVKSEFIAPINLVMNKYIMEIERPEIYHRWWKEIQKCTKLTATDETFKKTKFVMIRTLTGFVINGKPDNNLFIGYTIPWSNEILLAEPFTSSEKVVKHEMVHLLLWHNGKPAGHDINYFDKCKI